MNRLIPLLVLGLFIGFANSVAAQERVYIIRHADKAADGEDPPLIPLGERRAENWAMVLQRAGIDAVITSMATRTRQTGAIVAERLGVPTQEYPADDTQGLIDLIGFDYEDRRLLIVGHAETIPSILAGLGAEVDVEMSQDDFDHLFVVVPATGETEHLRAPFPDP